MILTYYSFLNKNFNLLPHLFNIIKLLQGRVIQKRCIFEAEYPEIRVFSNAKNILYTFYFII